MNVRAPTTAAAGVVFLAMSGGFFLWTPNTNGAAFTRPAEVRSFSLDGNLEQSLKPFSSTVDRGVSVASGDVTGDGQPELVVGAGPGVSAEVRILNVDGTRRAVFFPYGRGFRYGVNVAVGDLDDDGTDEIVTAPMKGAPHVRTFTGEGEALFSPGFYAFDRKMTNGVNIAVGDVTGDGVAEIIVAPGPGVPGHVRVLNRYGQFSGFDVFPFGREHRGGVTLAVGDVTGDGRGELLAAIARFGEPRVKVYEVNRTKDILAYFLAYPKTQSGGVQLAAADLDGDGKDEILAGVNAIGEPRVRVFDGHGRQQQGSFLAFERSFRGGVRLAAADLNNDGTNDVIAASGSASGEGRPDLYKYIEIDLSEQRLRYYEAGVRIGEEVISTGKWSTPTPIGTFSIKNHIDTAYSRPYNLYMDWWMAISPDGAYGIHALPFWKLKGGGRVYEGVNHLGTPVSHGCIRLSPTAAKILYTWADAGTPVIIHQ